MKISCPKIVEDKELVRYRVTVTSENLRISELFYELDKESMHLVSDLIDPALVGLLMPAMYYGENIYLEGKVSEELYWNLSFKLQKLLQTYLPVLHLINIYPDKLVPKSKYKEGERECATGFSGGIDSFCALADHFYDSKCPKSFKVTMLTYNNVGSHWSNEEGYQLFLRRYDRLYHAAEKMGLPLIKINSNLDEFYQDETQLRFLKTLVMRNASVALLLQKGVGKFLHASSHPYQKLGVNSSIKNITQLEPFILQLLSSCNTIELLSVGSEYNRVEKIKVVSKIEDSYKVLDVCTTEGKDQTNCSACVKCLRTLTALEILGILELYRESFNLETYKKNKNRFFGKVLSQHDEFTKEIYNLAIEKKFHFPLASSLYGIYYRLRFLIKKR